jgi:hypothetical protein
MAAHSYWTFATNTQLTNARTTAAQAAAQRGLQLVQSEWSMLDAAPSASAGFPEGGYDEATAMDIALYMGKVIYCDLVYASVSSWSYWTAFAQEQWGQKNRFYLLRVNAAGDTGTESYGDLSRGGTIVDSRNLWVLGNYSRFIRPGYRRVAVEGADEMNALMASSWVSADGNTLVSVFVNMNRISREIGLTIEGRSNKGVKTYVTDKDHDLQYIAALNDASDLEIPSRSVVTVVMTLGESSGISDIRAERAADNKIYSLGGQQVSSPQKGIYIKNGKKYIVK